MKGDPFWPEKGNRILERRGGGKDFDRLQRSQARFESVCGVAPGRGEGWVSLGEAGDRVLEGPVEGIVPVSTASATFPPL